VSPESIATVISILFGVGGTSLLVREVSRARGFEEVSRKLEPEKELLLIYHLNKREFAVRHLIWANSQTRQEAEDWLNALPAADSPRLADTWYPHLESQVAERIDHWFGPFAEGQMRLRKRLLMIGFACLLVSFAIQLVTVLAKASG
jgi:hypothetical protein